MSTSTRTLVETAIADLGYRPDGVARSLRTRRTHVVALIIPDITNPFYPVLSRGLEHALAGAGYRTFICSSDGDTDRELDFLIEVCDRRVDGIVLDSFHVSVDEVEEIARGDVPVVWIGGSPRAHPGVDSVRSDDEHGAFDATMHLVDRGHRTIAMVDGPEGSGTYGETVTSEPWQRPGSPGTRDTASGATGPAQAVPPVSLGCSRPSRGPPRSSARTTGARSGDRCSARARADDPRRVRRGGLRRHRGGSDDDAPLTTVRNPAFETGEAAGRLLGERMFGGYRGTARDVLLPASLVVRSSS